LSVLDEVRSLEKHVVARLRELEPALAEYEELRKLADRLELGYDPAANPPPTAKRSPRTRAAKPSGRRATRGRKPRRSPVAASERDQQVLAVIAEQPGVTAPELGKRLGVDYTGLYRVIRRLESRGQIRKDGPKLTLSAQPS
jgi:predicted HTH transcriptional regulator